MNHSSAISNLLSLLIAAVAVVLIAGLVFEGCQRSAERHQQVILRCIEHADSSAEAVICRNRVVND